MSAINVMAAVVLIVWACWCGLSRSVNDGIVGKPIYAAIALLSLAVVVNSATLWTYQALVVCFAALGVRHYYLRCLRKYIFKRISK